MNLDHLDHIESAARAPVDLAGLGLDHGAAVQHLRDLVLSQVDVCRRRPADREARSRLFRAWKRFQVLAPVLAVLAIGATLVPSPAEARADCGLIRDHAARRTCYAERDRRPSECSTISDRDAYRLCRLRAGDR